MHPKIWTQIIEVHFYISKLTREQKIQIYKKRKAGKSLQKLSKEYRIRKDNIEYLIRLIDRHGNHVLRKDKNKYYSPSLKEEMEVYHKFLSEKGIVQSMSRKGNCFDNSPIENFFGKMKNEMFYVNEYKYQSLKELRVAMEEYIEYYNTQRITTKLKGLTSVQFRNQSSVTA